ncbi:hypothetical protein ABZP36_000982 [Zizania latifolia]
MHGFLALATLTLCLAAPVVHPTTALGADTSSTQEAGTWGDEIESEQPNDRVETLDPRPSVLVGDTLYFPCKRITRILEMDVNRRKLAMIDSPIANRLTLRWPGQCSPRDGGGRSAGVRLHPWARSLPVVLGACRSRWWCHGMGTT